MAYKFRLGTTEMSGTLGTDDIHFTDDTDTGIDFESDKIKLETNNTSRLEVDNSRVQVLSQLVVGSTSAGDWSLAPPSEDALHVQDGMDPQNLYRPRGQVRLILINITTYTHSRRRV